jgi:hypothetical protein
MKPRKVIVDKVPPGFEHLAKPFNDPNGKKFEITFHKPTDIKAFLDYFGDEFSKQAGESYIWLPSPWWFADGRQRRIELIKKKRKCK